jgi:hypothetical protein
MSTTADPSTLAIVWEIIPLNKSDARCPEPRRQGHVCEIGFATFPREF